MKKKKNNYVGYKFLIAVTEDVTTSSSVKVHDVSNELAAYNFRVGYGVRKK
jgi:hypothetical protein